MSKLATRRADKGTSKPSEDEGGIDFGGGEGKILAGQDSLPHNRSYKRFTKVNQAGRAPRSGHVDAAVEDNSSLLPTPKRKRDSGAPVYMDPVKPSAQEVVAAVLQKSRSAREENVAKAATTQPWMLTKQQLQAMLDTLKDRYYADIPRIVVTIEKHRWLRSRLKEAAPKDFAAFLDWTFRYWSDTAAKQRATIKKDEDRRTKFTPMERVPNIEDIVKKYPYFLKVYSSFLADRTPTEKADEEKQEIKRLQRQLTQTQRELQVMSQRSTRRPVQQETDEYEVTRKRYARTPTRPKPEMVDPSEPIDLGPPPEELVWEENRPSGRWGKKQNAG